MIAKLFTEKSIIIIIKPDTRTAYSKSEMDRVIALIDMDCFYVQVEQRANPSLMGLPCAVVQYRDYKGGGIIAVNYEARARGVTRGGMMGDEAKVKCPEVNLVRVPELRGKADLTKYREAGAEVIEALANLSYSCCIERASIDEAYIDLTEEVEHRIQTGLVITADLLPNTVIAGFDIASSPNPVDDPSNTAVVAEWLGQCDVGYERRLAVGAAIVEEMRAAVYRDTQFRCSAGISHNKVLAKLACGMHKPNKQTILPQSSVHQVFLTMPIKKVRNFGGKLGHSLVSELGVEFMADLCKFTESELATKFGSKTGKWVYDICRGIEHEPVQARHLAQSIGCSKNFFGKEALDTKEKVFHWLSSMAMEVSERLKKDQEANHRQAKTMTASITFHGYPTAQSATRSCGLKKYDAQKIAEDAFSLLEQFNTAAPTSDAWMPPVVNLGISTGKFVDFSNNNTSMLKNFFGNQLQTTKSSSRTNGTAEAFTGLPSGSSTSSAGWKPPEEHLESKVNSLGNESRATKCTETLEREPLQGSYAKTETVAQLFEGSSNCSSASFLDQKQTKCAKSEFENNRSSDSSTESSKTAKSKGIANFFATVANRKKACDTREPSLNSSRWERFLDENNEVPSSWSLPTVHKDEFQQDAVPKQNKDSISSKNQCDNIIQEQNMAVKDPSVQNDGDWIKCEDCGKNISAWEMPEHVDFHFACELQKQCSRQTNSNSSNAKKEESSSGSSSKRKSSLELPSAKSVKKSKAVPEVSKTLDRFFKMS